MRRVIAAALISLTLAVGGSAAAQAEDTGAPESKLPAADAPNPATEKASKKNSKESRKKAKKEPKQASPADADAAEAGSAPKVHKVGSKPAKKTAEAGLGAELASTVICGVAGVPIAAAKYTKAEYIRATTDLVGDTDKKWLWVVTAPLCVPAGVLSGVLQSIVASPYHAWKNRDEPFCPEQFSLGD